MMMMASMMSLVLSLGRKGPGLKSQWPRATTSLERERERERDKLNDDEGDEDDATKTIDDKVGDEGGVDGNSRIK